MIDLDLALPDIDMLKDKYTPKEAGKENKVCIAMTLDAKYYAWYYKQEKQASWAEIHNCLVRHRKLPEKIDPTYMSRVVRDMFYIPPPKKIESLSDIEKAKQNYYIIETADLEDRDKWGELLYSPIPMHNYTTTEDVL